MNEKVEDWNGFSIHFVQFEGSWLWVADLEDICDALDLSADVVLNDIDRDYVFEMYEGNPFKLVYLRKVFTSLYILATSLWQ